MKRSSAAACVGENRKPSFERRHSTEEIERKAGLGRTAAGVGYHGVDSPPGETRHAPDEGRTAVGGRQIGHHIGISFDPCTGIKSSLPKVIVLLT